MRAGTPPNDTTITTPGHVSTGRQCRGSIRAKQYPGNNACATCFFRSFHRVHRITIGRNASIPLPRN
jgi:hypothetical protein